MLQKRRLATPTDADWDVLARSFGWACRERQVASRVATGADRKAVARDLGISLNTLQTHLRRALAKAGARNLVDLVWRVVARLEETSAPRRRRGHRRETKCNGHPGT